MQFSTKADSSTFRQFRQILYCEANSVKACFWRLLSMQFVYIFKAVVGTVISAMTGTTDPHEVAKMAKQAVQVKKKHF